MTELDWLDVFSDNLFDIMYENKMTQRELADASGLSEGTISKYLHKQQIPSLKAIINISHALDVSVSELIDFEENIE